MAITLCAPFCFQLWFRGSAVPSDVARPGSLARLLLLCRCLNKINMTVIPCHNISNRGKIDGHALETSVGDQGRRLDEHAVESFGVLNDRWEVTTRRICRGFDHGSVQIQNCPGLLTGNGRRLWIKHSGRLLLLYRCHGCNFFQLKRIEIEAMDCVQ